MKVGSFFFILTTCFILILPELYAQEKLHSSLDSLLARLPKAKEDTNKLNILCNIIDIYYEINPEEGLKYEKQSVQLADKLNWPSGIAHVKFSIGKIYWHLGQFDIALKYHFDVLKINKESYNRSMIASSLTAIGQDYADARNYPAAKKYFSDALTIFKELNDKNSIGRVYDLFSWVYNNEGNLVEASKNEFEALKFFEETGDKYCSTMAMSNIAEIYAKIGNSKDALAYFLKCIKPQEDACDYSNLSNTYNNIGGVYMSMGKYPEALEYQKIALKIGIENNNYYCIATSYNNIGDVYVAQKKYADALTYFLHAAENFEMVSNKQEVAGVYNKIGSCYTRLANYSEAKKYFVNEFALSKELDSKIALTKYYGGVELLDSATGNWKSAYYNFKHYIAGNESIINEGISKKLIHSQMQYEFDKKEAATKAEREKDDIRQRTIRNSIAAVLAGTVIFLMVVYRQRNKISRARKRSDELLLNILPAEIAEELKEKGSADARHYDEVTVMFTDFKGFTSISEKLSPSELVAEIDFCFKTFDNIITNHNIEKIKTIGDSYMCAAGLPVSNTTHATDVVEAAIEIQKFMLQHQEKRKSENREPFENRIGIHSGPVVAGIVGIKKFAYDIWGDTVNIASRMESSGEAGKINISGSTYELVKDKFTFKHRGKIQAKNKGEIDMYFVDEVS